MKQQLEIGTLASGAKFTLPLDTVAHTLAIIGMRGSGKTVAATVLAEEMCEAGLLWTAIDPVGVWWGLRCNPDGSPGGYPVVVIGGEHGDLPISKDAGPRIADAILEQNVSCVIDMSNESKNTVRYFVTEFCDRLMELRPEVPRHIFLEEAPELVPQRPMGEQKRSRAAVDRLMRLGRNRGYGGTLISQRFATIDKDVLTQGCENILAMRVIGKHDRDAVADWIAEVVQDTESKKKADDLMASLVNLESGTGFFWSPQWLNSFNRIRIRHRKTYHPGETRSVGQATKQVALSDVRVFVDRFRQVLTRETPVRPKSDKTDDERLLKPAMLPRDPKDEQEIARLRAANGTLSAQVHTLNMRLAAVQNLFKDDYAKLKTLFEEHSDNGAVSGDASVWQPWKEKLGKGPAAVIDVLLERGELTKQQIMTLTTYSEANVRNNLLPALRRNGLIEIEGGKYRLRQP